MEDRPDRELFYWVDSVWGDGYNTSNERKIHT